MTKISKKAAYPIKIPVRKDYFVGTDSENNGKTVNFDFESTAKLINDLNGSPILNYIFRTDSNINLTVLTEGVFLSAENETTVTRLTKLYINKNNFHETNMAGLFRFISINRESFVMKLRNSSNLSDAVYFRITDATEFETHFILDVDVAISNTAIAELVNFNVYFFDFELNASAIDSSDKLDKGGYEGTAKTLDDRIKSLSNPDIVLKEGVITVSGLTISIAANDFQWRLNQVSHLETPAYSKLLVSATEGYKRTDILEGDSTGNYFIKQGVEGEFAAPAPSVTVGRIRLGSIPVFGSTIGTPDMGSPAENTPTDKPISVYSAFDKGISLYKDKISIWRYVGVVSKYINIYWNNINNIYDIQFPSKPEGSEQTFAMLSDLENIDFSQSLRYESSWLSGSQEFTLPNNYYYISNVIVNGVDLKADQYSLNFPNKVTILNTLDPNDYIIILYETRPNTDNTAFYTRLQVDSFLTTSDTNNAAELESTFQQINSQLSGVVSGYKGKIQLSDTLVDNGIYYPIEAGTYTNAGGLVYSPTTTDANKIIYFIKAGTTWYKNVIPVDFNEYAKKIDLNKIINSSYEKIENETKSKKWSLYGTSIEAGGYFNNVALAYSANYINYGNSGGGILWSNDKAINDTIFNGPTITPRLSWSATWAEKEAYLIANNISYDDSARLSCFDQNLLTNLDSDLYIIGTYGINDRKSSFASAFVVDKVNRQFDRTTIYGAYNHIIKNLLSTKPTARILMIGQHAFGWTNTSVVNDIQRQVAKHWGIKFIDWAYDLGFSTQALNNGTLYGLMGTTYSTDGAHPNALGRKVMGDYLTRVMKDVV